MANPANEKLAEIQQQYPNATIEQLNRFGGVFQIEDNRKAIFSGKQPFRLETGEQVDTDWIVESSTDPDGQIWDCRMDSDYLGFAYLQNFNRGQLIKYYHRTKRNKSLVIMPMDLVWSNANNTSSWIASKQGVNAVLDGDSIRYNNCYKNGLDFEWVSLPAQLQKFFHIRSLAELGEPPQWLIDGGDPHLKIQFSMEVSAGIDIYIDRQLWDGVGRRITGQNVQFVDSADSEILWQFLYPAAYDANVASEDDNIRYAFQVSGSVLFVDVLVDWDWLQRTNYPVRIDPSVNPIIGASSDDAEEGSGGDTNTTGGTIRLQSANKWAGFRWTGITTPSGATVDVCYASLFYVNPGRLTTNLNLYFENIDSAPTFVAGVANDNISGRTKTASINWTDSPIITGYHDTVSLVSIAQTVINRAGFSDSMALLIEWVSDDVQWRAFDGNPLQAAEFYLEWTEGGTTIPAAATDTAALSETATTTALLAAGASDSMGLGETPNSSAVFVPIGSDSLALTDNSIVTANLLGSGLDNLSFAETAVVGAIFTALATDTAVFTAESIGDIISVITAAATDNLMLSETAVVSAILSAIGDDTVDLSDSAVAAALFIASAIDTFTSGDAATADLGGLLSGFAFDILAMSDTPAVIAQFEVNAADNVAFLETITAVLRLQAIANDVFNLSDIASFSVIEGGLRIEFKVRQATMVFTIRQPSTKMKTRGATMDFEVNNDQ